MKLQRATITPKGWEDDRQCWRHVEGCSSWWRMSGQGFIAEVVKPYFETTRRTAQSNPLAKLAETVLDHCREELQLCSDVFDVSVPTLVGTICNESAGNPVAFRQEYNADGTPNDASFGLTQMLSSTTLAVARAIGWPRAEIGDTSNPNMCPGVSCRGLLFDEAPDLFRAWSDFLSDQFRSIAFAAATHMLLRQRGTQGDPLLSYTAYNAGGLYLPPQGLSPNRYGLFATKQAVEAFVLFHNDCVAAMRQDCP